MQRVHAIEQRRPLRLPAGPLVALLTAGSAVVYLAMRLATARSIPVPWTGFCERVAPPDTFPCHMDMAPQARAYLLAALLIWAGLAGACLILALVGRGWLSIAPVAVLGVALAFAGAWQWFVGEELFVLPWLGVRSSPFYAADSLGAGYWAEHASRAAALDMLLLVAPAIAVIAFVRPARAARSWQDAALIRWSVYCGIGVALIIWQLHRRSLAWEDLGFDAGLPVLIPAVVVATFGYLLPARRTWWPWAIVPVAILVSAAPSTFVMSTQQGWSTTLWFRLVPWLVAIGVLASLAEPLATRKQRGDEVPASSRRVRWTVVANATAAALVLVCMIAAHADPLPARYETPLGTFLGLRELAEGARAEMNLLQAIEAFDDYRSANGAVGFDASAARALAPALRWTDGAPTHLGAEPLAVSVLGASPTMVRFGITTGFGAAYCAQATKAAGWRGTYGSGTGPGLDHALHQAIRSCGATPLAADVIPTLPVATLCDGVDRDGLVLCRAVQFEVTQTLTNPRAG